ncbi:TonB-dependent receptor [bacterium]|nr:TonB-dependent receptor [bacterium]
MKRLTIALLLLVSIAFTFESYSVREIHPPEESGWIVIEESAILAASAEDLPDFLATLPEVRLNDTGVPGGLITISLRGASSSQTLILVDGIPQSQPTNGTTDLSAISLDDLARIEIYRGVASDAYGSAALGGVINLVTKSAVVSDAATFGITFGNGGMERYSGSVHGTLGPVQLRVGGAVSNHDGWRDNSASDKASLNAKLSADFDDHRFALGFSLLDATVGVPGPTPSDAFVPEFGSKTANSLFDNQEDNYNSLTLNYAGRLGGLTLHADLGWRTHDLDYHSRYRGFYLTELDAGYLTETLYGSLWTQFELMPELALEIGADYRSDTLDAESVSTEWVDGDDHDPTATPTTWTPDVSNIGGWLEVAGSFNTLTAAASARLDYHSDFGINVAPRARVGISFDQTRIGLAGGTAFRAPTLNDLYWPTGGNADLKPEKGWEAELDIEQELDFLWLNADVFYRQTSDLIAWQPDATGANWSPTNVDEQTVLGAGLILRTPFLFGASLRASYTFLSATQNRSEVIYSDFVNGETRTAMVERRAAFLPEHQLSASLIFGDVDTGFSVTANWLGDRVAYYPDYSNAPDVTMTEKTIPAALTLDARFEYRMAQGFSIFAGVKNLTDSDIPVAFGNTAADNDYPAEPRHFSLGAEISL